MAAYTGVVGEFISDDLVRQLFEGVLIVATENSRLSAGQIILAIIYILLVPILVLLLSGDWLWVEGWIFRVWLIIISVSTVIYLYRKDPELLRERFKPPFRTLNCHNRFLRNFCNRANHFLYTKRENWTGDRQPIFLKLPKFVV